MGYLPEGPLSFLRPSASGGVVGRNVGAVLTGSHRCPLQADMAQRYTGPGRKTGHADWPQKGAAEAAAETNRPCLAFAYSAFGVDARVF